MEQLLHLSSKVANIPSNGVKASSRCGHLGFDRRLTVGSLSLHKHNFLFKLSTLLLLLALSVGNVWADPDHSFNESWNFTTSGNNNWTSTACGSYCGAWGKNKSGSPIVSKSNISNFANIDFSIHENVSVTIYVTAATNGGTNSYTVKLINAQGNQVSTYSSTKNNGMGSYSNSADDAEESYVTFSPTQAFSGYKIEFNPKSFITNTRYVLTYDDKPTASCENQITISKETPTNGSFSLNLFLPHSIPKNLIYFSVFFNTSMSISATFFSAQQTHYG